MHNPLSHFYRLAVPAALIAAGLAFGASGARADDDRPRGIDVEIRKGALTISGSENADALALRLKPGKPQKLQIDAGDAGRADKTIKRSRFDRIVIETRDGADTGLAATVSITRAEAALDRLSINGLGGADTLDTSGLAPNTIGLTFTE